MTNNGSSGESRKTHPPGGGNSQVIQQMAIGHRLLEHGEPFGINLETLERVELRAKQKAPFYHLR